MSDCVVAVYLVTYRRQKMLLRAVKSVLCQTYTNFIVRIVNDDPSDGSVARLLCELDDRRIKMFEPIQRRGATKNFNLMFEEKEAQFVALLEDDNWWEPSYLETMVSVLMRNPDDFVAVANERIWRELPGDAWQQTQRAIWNFSDVRRHRFALEDVCGSAKLCNSSALYRLGPERTLRTPDSIPVDVTEHFRERLFDDSVILVGEPLVNYAETVHSARSVDDTWSLYQILLIGSFFIAAPTAQLRCKIAARLWSSCAPGASPRAVSLAATGYAIPEARCLLSAAPWVAKARLLVWLARRPTRIYSLFRIVRHHKSELQFLASAPLTQQLLAESV